MTTKAFAYLRTSSATNAGADKDSDKRQVAAIEAYAKAHGIEIVGSYYDVQSGADPILERAGFRDMLTAIVGNGVRTILVESPDRFARDLMVQMVGHDHLRSLGVELVPTTAPDYFTGDTPTAVLIRQILGAVAQFEKASSVARMLAARKRTKAKRGYCEGRHQAPLEARERAKELRAQGVPLRKISADLAARGFLAPSGKPYLPGSIVSML
jgi:DNA invertase Pin-like site-specific DNA recombinase